MRDEQSKQFEELNQQEAVGGELERSERSEQRCAGHGAVIEGESPLWVLSEVTMSERQLHESTSATEVSVA